MHRSPASRTSSQTRRAALARAVGPALAVWALALAALAPSPALAARVVVVKNGNLPAYEQAFQGFRSRFDGEVVLHQIGKDEDVSHALAQQILSEQPDLVLAIGSRAATSLHERLPQLPLVFAMVLSPEKRGLVGPNVTGVSLDIPAREQLRQFRRVLPKLNRVGVVYNPAKAAAQILEARDAAGAAGVSLVERQIEATADVPSAVESLGGTVDALWVMPDATVVTHETFKHMVEVSLRRKMPLLVFAVPFVKAGALMAVAPDYTAMGEEAGRLAREIAAGRQAGAIPLIDPRTSIVINEATAGRMGLGIPSELRSAITLVK